MELHRISHRPRALRRASPAYAHSPHTGPVRLTPSQHLNTPCPLRLYDPCGGGPVAQQGGRRELWPTLLKSGVWPAHPRRRGTLPTHNAGAAEWSTDRPTRPRPAPAAVARSCASSQSKSAIRRIERASCRTHLKMLTVATPLTTMRTRAAPARQVSEEGGVYLWHGPIRLMRVDAIRDAG